jgi:hypothetical protein
VRHLTPVPLSTRPRVSVVVPCYNYGHYLPAAVASALDQEGVDVEVLIVDDCSTDDSAAVAVGLAAADPRVDVLVHETNRGHIATYNDGLAKVSGDYVALLSADDLLAPGALTRAVSLMEAQPSVGLVYGAITTFVEQPPPEQAAREGWSVWAGEEWLERVCRRGRNVIVSPEAVMRTELVRELDGYDPRHPHAADMLMWTRAAARADVGRVNGPRQAAYRVHGANMHLVRFSGQLTDYRATEQAFEALFDAEPSTARLRRPARTALGREVLLAAEVARAGGEEIGEATAYALAVAPDLGSTPLARRCGTEGQSPARRAWVKGSSALRWRYRAWRWRRWGL